MEPEKRDLVLAPGEYAYMQDTTKGQIKVFVGPTIINATAQERPVVYFPPDADGVKDSDKGRFRRVSSLEDAVRKSPIAVQGYYLVLFNPAKDGQQPDEGTSRTSPDLVIGRKINIPGPCMFALWPGQDAHMIRGHHLRSNQYLLVRVYDEDEARQNWEKAVIKPQATTGTGEGGDDVSAATVATGRVPADLAVGRELIIRGTEVSFYIPPTGISVVPDESGSYVRDALTLERLEYCILVDEDGNKRYEIGPQVVFPTPTEQFMTSRRKDDAVEPRKFRATELNEIQGLHIKVIDDYEENERFYRQGEELFITGKDTTIYFPRPQHSIIKYDGKSKHFATAIPRGEARYVLERLNGNVRLEVGPQMLLPDPRSEVVVRRVLSDRQCALWYPGNVEAMAYNQHLRQLAAKAPTTRTGTVSEGEVLRSARTLARKSGTKGGNVGGMSYASLNAAALEMDQSLVSSEFAGYVGDEFSRASTYTEPRTVTLDTKYQGVPSVDVWTGYAVMVVSRTGERRVEQGPKTILLGYDESLEVLSLSRGKPKTTDALLETVYLRVLNNKVSDVIDIETRDHVKCSVKLSLRVSFTGDPNAWFTVENYVKFLTDHVRSVLKGAAKRVPIQEFYRDYVAIVRDTILGTAVEGHGRPGMVFSENGMHVTDVEVLDVTIRDNAVSALLDKAQHGVMSANITLESEIRNLEIDKQRFEVQRERMVAHAKLSADQQEQQRQQIADAELTAKAKHEHDMSDRDRERALQEAAQAISNLVTEMSLLRQRKEADQIDEIETRRQVLRLKEMAAQTEAVVARFAGAVPGFSEALMAASNNELMAKVAEAWSIQRVIGGQNLSEALARVFDGTPFQAVVRKLTNGNNGNTVEPVPVPPTTPSA